MKKLTSCFGLILVLIIGGWLYVNIQIEKPNASTEGTKTFVVEEGTGVSAIADNLKEQGFLAKPLYLKIYVAMKDLKAKFLVGEYQLDTSMSPKQLVTELTTDRSVKNEVRVTILEGWNIVEIAEYLQSLELFPAQEFLEYVEQNDEFSFEFLRDKPDGASLEGYLYPDTYMVFEDAEPIDVVAKMLKNFDNKLDNEMRSEISRQGKDIFDIVTLASVVEKEMFGYENRRVVADIFWARVNDNYLLQSDATVNYFTKKGTTRPSIDDTNVDNPYNTYEYKGLPPGPIGNPSIEAIKATIYPAETDYYYFLTDPEGEIYYARNLDEHIINRNKYLD